MTLLEALAGAQVLLLAYLAVRSRGPKAPKKQQRPGAEVLQQIDALVVAVAATQAHKSDRRLTRVAFVQRCLQAAHRSGIDLGRYEAEVRSRANVHPI